MFGKTRHAGWDPNDFSWSIPQRKHHEFEEFIYYYLKRRAAQDRPDFSFKTTPRSGDEGRDIELTFQSDFTIGGAIVPASPGRPYSRAFIECKTTSSVKLGDEFLSDSSQHRGEEFSSYVLVTNAVITPYSYFRGVKSWEDRGAKFILVDRARLWRAWVEAGIAENARRAGLAPISLPPDIDWETNRLFAAVQSKSENDADTHRAKSYVLIRNHTPQDQKVSLSLASDFGWKADTVDFDIILAPGEDLVHCIESERARPDLDTALRFSLAQNQRDHNLVVVAAKPQLVLETPFLGQGHHEVLSQIRRCIEGAEGLKVISVHGEAGVGKSRTIKEATQALGSTKWYRLDVACSPQSGHFNYRKVVEDARPYLPSFLRDDLALPETVTLGGLIKLFEHWQLPVILTLEDLHHARPDDILEIKTLITEPREYSYPVILIVSGRDDNTFPNPDYFALLDLVAEADAGNTMFCAIAPLSDEDAIYLIRSVAENLPDIAVNRIHALGQNNPFIIIEVLQYLLDVKLARLLSRRTIGILDPERFSGLDDLPKEVEELYQLRLSSLRATSGGEAAWLFLCAASFMGPVLSERLIELWLGEHSDETIEILEERRFLSRSTSYQFSHENIYHFLRRWLRRPANAQTAAPALLELTEIVNLFSPLARGELLSLAGHHREAFSCFRPAWEAIQAITNFSSEEIERGYFPILPAIFATAAALDEPKSALAKVPQALGYMGVHNFPLWQGEQACTTAEKMLVDIYKNKPEGQVHSMTLHQLRSHSLQNMGRTGEALRRMLELEGAIKEMLPEKVPQTVAYDLYDRLQEHFRKSNHANMMTHYGTMAAAACRAAGDEKMEAAHLITQSLTQVYQKGEAAIGMVEKAIQAAKDTGIQRFITFNQLSLLIVQTLRSGDDLAALKEISREAHELHRYAAVNTYSDSIIRVQLLLATLAPLVTQDPNDGRRIARIYIRAGQESSIRFGIGLYDWAFDNLAGAIDQWDPKVPSEQTRRRFEACLERLRRRGLTFVGASSGTFPNVMAIANVLRYYARFSDKSALELLSRQISSYDQRAAIDQDYAFSLVEAAQKGKAVFWPSANLAMLRLPAETDYFTPIF